jgi:phytanoyl-CoA hydroxylase
MNESQTDNPPTDSPISDEMLDHYWEHGYVVAPGLIGADDLERWLARLSDIVEGRVEPSQGMLVMRDVMVAKGAVSPETPLEAIAKIQDYENDPVLDSYTTHERVLDCVERFIGHDVQTIHTMLINKPPNVDGRHPLHQDLLYFPFRPADRIVASWTALERVTKENGCLVALPGTHKGELVPHENPDFEFLNGGYFGARFADAEKDDLMQQRVHLEMEPGDTVFFHPVLLHGSGRNRTQGFRRAISAHYTALDVEWAWATPETFERRNYRIVRGDRAGERWQGPVRSAGKIDPLSYLPFGPAGNGPGEAED